MPEPLNLDLTHLNPAQRAAVLHRGGPLLIIAGAGSGKTKTLTHRIAHFIATGTSPERLLAITFTNKAAKEMKERLEQLLTVGSPTLPFVGTFHSWGARVLKREAARFGRTSQFSIFDDDDSLRILKSILKAMNLDSERFKPVTFRHNISHLKDELADLSRLSESPRPFDRTLAAVFHAYESALRENNAFDFDDLIEKVGRLFQGDPQILAHYRDQYDHVLVDEYQDVNAAQYQLVRLLAGEKGNVSVVGDDAQAIYAFRGSDFRIFLNFDRDWPNAHIVKLEENYRSTAHIISAASEVIKKNALQKPKNLWTKQENGPLITITGYATAEDEAYATTRKILELFHDSTREPNIAILYRTNAQSRPIEYALLQNGVPYRIYGSLRFYDRMEIKDILACLQYACNPQHSLAAERIKKTFLKKLGATLLEELPQHANETLIELLDYIMRTTRYAESLIEHHDNGAERLENVNELIAYAGTYNHLGLAAFLEQVSLASSLDLPGGAGATLNEKALGGKGIVTLMTVHAAKGLEFNQVFVVGCAEGLIPHERSILKNNELEEERRLMYVAMTRAKQELTLSFFGTPSRFLYEIPAELTVFTDHSSAKRKQFDTFEEEDYIEYD